MTSNPMDNVIQLINQYKGEFEFGISELMKHAGAIINFTSKGSTYQQFNIYHQKLLKQRDEMLIKIRDTHSALPDLDTIKLLNAFTWMAIMLLGLSFGAILGGILFPPFLEFIISGTDAAFLAYFVLPLTVYYFLHLPMEIIINNDLFRRHLLFLFATLEGLLTGYIFSNKDLISAPPIAALTPIAIGLIPHFGSTVIGNDRVKLISLTIGGGFILHLLVGTIISLSLPYLLLAALYGFIGFATLQLCVNNIGKDPTLTHIYQLSFVCAVIFSQALIYIIFGLDERELAEATRSSLSFL